MTITVNRKDFIKQLSSVNQDNIGIGDVLIDRKKLLTALKLQDDDVLSINYGNVSWPQVDNETCIQFQCNNQTFRFLNRPKNHGVSVKYLNFIDAVMNAEKKVLTGIPIDTDDLLDALKFVQHGITTELTRLALNCVLFDSTESGILRLVSADGFRLPVAEMQVGDLPQEQVLLHYNDIKTLINFLKSNTTGKGRSKIWLPVYLEYGMTYLKFSSELGTHVFQKQALHFPNYVPLIPTQGTHIQLIANDLLQAVKSVTPIAKDGSGIVRLQFCKDYPFGKVTVSSNSEELGTTAVDCDAKVDSDCKIAVNSNYLKQFLSTCKDTIIDLFIQDISSPIVAHNGLEQYEVIMPMFVNWSN